MSETLKDSVHQLVEEIENEQQLETLRDYLSLKRNSARKTLGRIARG